MNIKQLAFSLTLSLSISLPALAASPEEAAQLGGDKLTEIGAQKAGNADGSIPSWTPGWKGPSMPANVGIYPDPFADEKPLLTITAANLEQYADKVSEGTKVLLKRWPDYKLEVYKSHRVVDFPDWLKAATAKNATRAKSTFNGEDLEGAMGGYPFPLPKTGAEVIWNHTLRYFGPAFRQRYAGLMIDSAGNRVLVNDMDNYTDSPYHDNPEQEQQYYQRRLTTYVGPARNVGDKVLSYMVMHAKKDGNNKFWIYTQGQRRTRQAPEFAYDSPLTNFGGAFFNDEVGMWEGQMDRFDFKLVGKKEIYVPYNNYKFLMHTLPDEAFGKQFANPDKMRWELHRIWQVEATLKPGMRHAQSKKVFYVDEDSWSIVLYEGYDQAGKIMRSAQGLVTYDWNTQSVPNTPAINYDLIKGQYSTTMHLAGRTGYVRVDRWANGKLTPDSMAGSGIR